MSKYVVAIMSAAEIGALHHIITDELENGVLDVENQALLSNAQAKLDEALRTAGESLSPAVPASKSVKPHSPESFCAYERFKLQWMLDHKHTLQELLCELDAYSEDCGDAGSMQELMDVWEKDRGFGGEMWPCYEEWLECEAKSVVPVVIPAQEPVITEPVICGGADCVYHDGNCKCMLPSLVNRMPNRDTEDAVYGESCCMDFLPAELNDGTKEAAHE